MAPRPIVFPPPPWVNQDIVVYHGTVDASATAIMSSQIIVGFGRPNTDFGPGFYTTTLKRQAQMWAAQLSATKGTSPAVIEFTINRQSLASLNTLAFVRGDFDADDYWSLIHHCRTGALSHGPGPAPFYYDAVYGPVTAFWNQRMIIADADQISFHTAAAESVLNASFRSRII